MKSPFTLLFTAAITSAIAFFSAAPAPVSAAPNTATAGNAVATSDVRIQNLSNKYGLGPEPHVKGVLEVVHSPFDSKIKTQYQWYIGDTRYGVFTKLNGIHAKTIILLRDYIGKYLRCEVTAKDAQGNIIKTMTSVPTCAAVLPITGNPLTDWLYESRYGISHHLLKEFIEKSFTPKSEQWDANKQTWSQFIDQFNVQKYAKQVSATGAKFILLTLNQNSGYYITPIAAYDKYMREAGFLGDGPNPMTSKRDLPLEIIDELSKYGIKVMLYHPANPPNNAHWKDKDYRVTSEVFHYTPRKNGAPVDKARQIVNEIISELSVRYGEKLAGFWFDGFYNEPASMYNNMDNAYNIADLANAAKKGNPYRIIAFNTGWDKQFHKSTPYSDFSSGEDPNLNARPSAGRLTDGDCQKMLWGVLGRMDNPVHGWGCPGVSKKTDFVVDCAKTVTSRGTVLILDTRVSVFGVLDPLQAAQLAEVKKALTGAKTTR